MPSPQNWPIYLLSLPQPFKPTVLNARGMLWNTQNTAKGTQAKHSKSCIHMNIYIYIYHVIICELMWKCMPVMVVSLGSKLRHKTNHANKHLTPTLPPCTIAPALFSDIGKGLHSIAVGTTIPLCSQTAVLEAWCHFCSKLNQCVASCGTNHGNLIVLAHLLRFLAQWLEGFNKIIENVWAIFQCPILGSIPISFRRLRRFFDDFPPS